MRTHTINAQLKALFASILALVLSVTIAGCGGTSQEAAQQEAATNAETSAETPTTTDASTKTDAADDTSSDTPIEVEQDDDAIVVVSADELEDGTYDIEVETDSSMFRADSCTLTAEDGVYTAALSLPGEGFSRLYFGSAEDAAAADDADIVDYYLNDDGKYTFDLTVEALDEELPIAAYGHRRDTWYDHTITFHAPSGE